jgi:hypothetical protein
LCRFVFPYFQSGLTTVIFPCPFVFSL